MNRAFRSITPVPADVCIHITQLAKEKAAADLTDSAFEPRLQSFMRKELKPLGLTLRVRDLPDGGSRFLLKEENTGAVCATMDFTPEGTLEIGRFESLENGFISGVSHASQS